MINPPAVSRKPGWEQALQSGTLTRDPKSGKQFDARYYRFETSGLTYTVTQDGSKNHFEIQLDPDR